MAGIGSLAAASTSASSQSSVAATDRLGKQDFLRLLVAQLRNQDPMKPMDDTEFIAQLAQFSSLEALGNLDKRLESLALTQGLGQASALIGKQVTAGLEDGSVIAGAVSAVHLTGGETKLLVNAREIDISQVRSVTA